MIKKELLRKLIHFLGLGYIPLYLKFGKEVTFFVVVISTLLAIIIELLRHRVEIIPRILLRDYEIRGFGAYVYFGISATIVTALLPMESCIVAIVVASLGDGISGIVKQINKAYSSISMFIFSFSFLIFLSFYINLRLFPAFFACILATLTERIQKVGKYYINDNLSVPIVSALTHYLASLI